LSFDRKAVYDAPAMSFPWLEVKRPASSNAKAAATRDEMYRHELEDRAALLFRLRFPKERAKARLRANVSWDFELHGRPRHAADIDRVVDAVYRRGGGGSGPPSV
jgi:hypothetical protein